MSRLYPRAASRARAVVTALVAIAVVSACAEGDRDEPGASGTASSQVAQGPEVPGLDTMAMTVYKTRTCGCCKAWVDHMREDGFRVTAVDVPDLMAIKREYGVEPAHSSCHTAVIGGYVVEGHVPASDVRRLLVERPEVTGLAVPGMPVGSPGMEGGRPERYDVLAFVRDKGATVFSTH